MGSKIKGIISQLNVSVEEVEGLDADGHYIAELNLIVLNADLSDWGKQLTLLHELGHAARHHNEYGLYSLAFSLHSKMEDEAEKYMVEQMIYLRTCDPEFNLETFDSINFLESLELDLRYEPFVKKFMSTQISDEFLKNILRYD